jgi:hypothetical protein
VSQSARSRSAPSARLHALKRTRRLLQSDTVEYLRSLPRTILIEDSVVLVHGGVRDVQQYMTTPLHAFAISWALPTQCVSLQFSVTQLPARA